MIRGLGGVLFLAGALIMAYNVYMTAKGRVRGSEDVPLDTLAQPAE
ncbi:hypothetical protein JCM17844_15290 [Iodidimonas gelatinilytica]|uniref:Uncharacterized protein n=1 Tax=Iodidimonas gelatinilytica TaxID=1236966 RepID=A0A5A7MPC5_9PROT|nr:hypothetical protein [Iodidimonas gelatinilytica]GEQ97892.1 hypothetical protein JCM17844_15290 [Iodidimonas gelatinilytica]GEQ99984.1 hypothetical protein JCM17845_06080 [Iodidimonas gelatinilytica]GER07531.1 hypothetical protein JCM17843_18410 [Kordiimonadales bacterium JCM 17843]